MDFSQTVPTSGPMLYFDEATRTFYMKENRPPPAIRQPMKRMDVNDREFREHH